MEEEQTKNLALSGLSALAPGISSAFGAANFLYNMYKDAKVWRREDTAFRRATKDMDLAGLNTFNASSVSQSGSSQSSALANYLAMKQAAQRDRELSMMEALNREKVLLMQYGMFAQKFGTAAAGAISSTLGLRESWKQEQRNPYRAREDYQSGGFWKNFYRSTARGALDGM